MDPKHEIDLKDVREEIVHDQHEEFRNVYNTVEEFTVGSIPNDHIRKEVRDELKGECGNSESNSSPKEQIQLLKYSKLTEILNRMENMFDRENDTKWRSIKKASHDLIDQNPTAEGVHQIIQAILTNGKVESELDAVNKFLHGIIIVGRIFERLDQKRLLDLTMTRKIIGLFLRDVFIYILKPLIDYEIVNYFLPTLNETVEHSDCSFGTSLLNTTKLGLFATFCGGGGVVLHYLLNCFGIAPVDQLTSASISLQFGLLRCSFADAQRKAAKIDEK